MKFINGAPALVCGDWLVIADLHLGFEEELFLKGFSVPIQTEFLLSRILALRESAGAAKLLILGDVKHNVPVVSEHEINELSIFFKGLREAFNEVVVVKGNHDGLLERYSDVKVVKEFKIDKFLFIHGHALPSSNDYDALIMAHLHPLFVFEDSVGSRNKLKCWVTGRVNGKRLIIMPAFNDFIGGKEIDYTNCIIKELTDKETLLLDLTRVE